MSDEGKRWMTAKDSGRINLERTDEECGLRPGEIVPLEDLPMSAVLGSVVTLTTAHPGRPHPTRLETPAGPILKVPRGYAPETNNPPDEHAHEAELVGIGRALVTAVGAFAAAVDDLTSGSTEGLAVVVPASLYDVLTEECVGSHRMEVHTQAGVVRILRSEGA